MDLREHLEKLDKIGWLTTISREVDWRLEVACIDAMNARLDGPRSLFNNIKGYSQRRLVNNFLEGSRERFWRGFAFALGMDPEIDWIPFVKEVYRRVANTIKPVQVSTGPCKENIRIGKEVNLFDFPWPYLHEGDGGRFGTLMTWIMKDPDSSWVNWGNFRMQIHTKNKVGIQTSEGGDAWLISSRYELRSLSMPVCIAFGCEPAVTMATIFRALKNESEVDMAGGLQEEPVQLVKAETSDLLVPASAEIVLEGEIRPYEKMDEGPFGEMIGFMHGPRVPRPVVRINCITFRSNPILPFLAEGMESGAGRSLSRVPGTLGMNRGLKIAGSHVSRDSQLFTNWRVGIGTLWQKEPGSSDESLFHSGGTTFRWLVDPDDWEPPADLAGFIEATFLKTHPTQFKVSDPDMSATHISLLSPEDKKKGTRALCGVDATWPAHWKEVPQRIRFENQYSSQVQKWVIQNWEQLGLPGKASIKKPRTRQY